MTKDVISLSISVLLLFRHYIYHKITFGAPSSGGVLCSACGAFIKSSRRGREYWLLYFYCIFLCGFVCASFLFMVTWVGLLLSFSGHTHILMLFSPYFYMQTIIMVLIGNN